MGGALLFGMLNRGLDPKQVIVQDPNPSDAMRAELDRAGVRIDASIGRLQTPPAVIFLAVKPQAMDDVLPGIADIAGPESLVVSVAAGLKVDRYAQAFPKSTAIVRAMPNTPAAIGQGMTVCSANRYVTNEHKSLCNAMFDTVGKVAWIEDEDLMDAVTAVSGSGPAYVFLMVEAMTSAGIEAGLGDELAASLARQTVVGAGALLSHSKEEAATLRTNVTSPGGTTAAALDVLMREPGLSELMRDAIIAAKKRGRELAG